jgi:hypothetical protein
MATVQPGFAPVPAGPAGAVQRRTLVGAAVAPVVVLVVGMVAGEFRASWYSSDSSSAACAAAARSGRPVERGVHPVDQQPGGPAAWAVVIASATKDSAPRAEFAVPPRMRVPASTGAHVGVDTRRAAG